MSARASAIYAGSVRHRRLAPVAHDLRARVFMMYLDLDELPELFDGRLLWSARRPAPAWFRRADHLGPSAQPLADAVRALVSERTGDDPGGPVRLLTNLRHFGYGMNPVSFFYCFEETGERVRAVVAEVTNTPWGERHHYVLPVDGIRTLRGTVEKALHVSPFMGLDHTYDWRLSAPGETLSVHIESLRDGEAMFDATLALRRRAITTRSLAAALLRHPCMTASVAARIYGHAALLALKGAPYFAHPTRGCASSHEEAWTG